MKQIMSEGGLIPYQLTVKILVNALSAQPAKVIYRSDEQFVVLFDRRVSESVRPSRVL